jgi:hypothetical protein
LFLFLGDGNIVISENVVALVRRGGRTRVVLRDGDERESGFTPLVIGRRSVNFGKPGSGGVKLRERRKKI